MLFIKCKTIVDSNGVREKQNLLIDGDAVKAVGEGSTPPPGAHVIDASDKVVMPGLIDCHVHFTGSVSGGIQKFTERYEVRLIRSALQETRALLMAGFTSVMDAGGLVGLHVRNAIEEGLVIGPRVVSSGRYIGITGGHGDTHSLPLDWVKEGRPYGWGMEGRIADGVEECTRAVREQLREGVDFIKILTSGGGGSLRDPPWVPEYGYEEIRAMTTEAHGWRRRVMAHCYNPEAIERSVEGGVDIIAHGNMADDKSIRLMKDRGVTVVPTMAIYQAIADRIASGGTHPGGSRVPELYSTLYEDVRRLHDGGINIAMGTDTMGDPLPFGKNAKELQLYVDEVGLSPIEAIRIGTMNGAKAMGRADIGLIEPGMKADIIVLEKNPLDDIGCLQDESNVKLVLKNGAIYKNDLS